MPPDCCHNGKTLTYTYLMITLYQRVRKSLKGKKEKNSNVTLEFSANFLKKEKILKLTVSKVNIASLFYK